ncbi:GAF domain-containing protein [Paenibacillus peoriae]|uniref:GAF domain-containing protein n=1 Tax=Paenibacillus peoriae TaxID=59893 RepID=UPI00026C634F|nr:GAF domain-containing protein [Paenibacillus peoriae]MEC0184882.1 GAF domain-containing protein [Paenibacillus peoriae]
MLQITDEMRKELNQLRDRIYGDLTALAFMSKSGGGKLHWYYVSGSRSNRYRLISFKVGHGIAGLAVRLGRTVTVSALLPGSIRLRQECALMLAEQLHSAIAIPFSSTGNLPNGVLLFGNRYVRTFTDSEVAEATQVAQRLGELCAHPSTS